MKLKSNYHKQYEYEEEEMKTGGDEDGNIGDEDWRRWRELRKEDDETMCTLYVMDALF